MEGKGSNLVKKRGLTPIRRFSEVIKRQTVLDIEQGKCSVLEASRELSVSCQTVYTWIYKYSRYLQKNKILVVEDKSESYKTKELEIKLQKAEAALGRKQMELDFLNKLIDLASAELKLDIKKNFSSHASNGTEINRA
ncbi:MAG: transposase, partial [Saprospiraceae bacterium]|nr:transposase [Saprospiraceae bacterium]